MDAGTAAADSNGYLTLAGWRREVADMYREVREADAPEAAWRRWRERRDRLFLTHPDSPLGPDDPMRAGGVPYWPYDPALRFTATITPPDTLAYDIATAEEEVTHLRLLGWAELPEPLSGRLAVWWLAQYGGGIFLPFRDATAGEETYGAGRYLLDTAKGADLGGDETTLLLDFNFAYHPSCRYDPQWQCPLAPPENHLSAAIRAGERLSPDDAA